MLTTSPTLTAASITIDCTAGDREESTTKSGISGVVQWVQASPQSSAVHVFLPGKTDDAFMRTAQRRLLALGCRVTTKYGI